MDHVEITPGLNVVGVIRSVCPPAFALHFFLFLHSTGASLQEWRKCWGFCRTLIWYLYTKRGYPTRIFTLSFIVGMQVYVIIKIAARNRLIVHTSHCNCSWTTGFREAWKNTSIYCDLPVFSLYPALNFSRADSLSNGKTTCTALYRRCECR